MRINHLTVGLLVVSSIAGHAEGLDSDKVNALATAISHAEGFGRRGTIPSRYHNPGDLKTSSGSVPLTGQVRIGKAGHIVFKDDQAGKAALRNCIVQMMDGRSTHFRPHMTLDQVARVYAKNWRPWVKIVSTELGVPPSTTLWAYFHKNAAPTAENFRSFARGANPLPVPPLVRFPESRNILDAVLDIPVDVPPLVEDVPQHHRWRAVSILLRPR